MLAKSNKETAEQKLLKMIEATSGTGKVKVDQNVLKKQTFLSVLKAL